MRLLYWIICVVGVLVANSLYAAEVPFGADSLGYLTKRASVVASIDDPKVVADDPVTNGRVFAVRVSEVLVPGLDLGPKNGDIIQMLYPVGDDDEQEARGLRGCLVFLRKVPDKRAAFTKLDGPVYETVSGKLGAIPAEYQSRQAIAREYLRTPSVERLAWAERYIENKDQFVQRSALFEAAGKLQLDPENSIKILRGCPKTKGSKTRDSRVLPTLC